jgi:hypothetical protein
MYLESKLSTVILMGCSLDIKKWIPFMTQIMGFETKTPLSYNYHRSFISGTRSMVFDLRLKKLLVLNKQMDIFAPGSINQASMEELRKMHSGREGHDWKVMTLPGEQHAMADDYLGNANEWIRKWLVPNDLDIVSKI